MEIIIPMISAAEKICGRQKIVKSTKYRFTRHCIQLPCDDGTLLFHTLTGSLLHLSDTEIKNINDKDNVLVSMQTERIDELVHELKRLWYFVPETFDENKYADDVQRVASMLSGNRNGKDSFTILTTTDGNARCFYCYEAGCNRINMDEKTALDVAEHVVEEAAHKEIRIAWFGGEPLYNIPAIDIIIDYLQKHGISFYSCMTSNGYYLTPELSRKAVDQWKLRSVQITIDGTRDVYNRTKAYIDTCPDPFSRILDNIEAALDVGIKVFIRLNVDQRNVDDVFKVVDILGSRFQNKKNCRIHVALLKPFSRKIHEFEENQKAVHAFFSINDKIKVYGLDREQELKTGFYTNRCMADSDTAELIMPDGRIGKCEHFRDDELIGSIYSPERNERLIREWKVREHMPECTNCSIYPRCINLKMCAWTKLGCSPAEKMIRTQNLERLIIQEYHKWMKRQKG